MSRREIGPAMPAATDRPGRVLAALLLGGVLVSACADRATAPGNDGGAAGDLIPDDTAATPNLAGRDDRSGADLGDSRESRTRDAGLDQKGGPARVIGIACRLEEQCDPGGDPAEGVCLTGLPGGYCSSDCSPDGGTPCGPGEVCSQATRDGLFLCLKGCSGDPDCRVSEGYACATGFNGWPSASPVCVPGVSITVPVGSPCTDGTDCQAGTQACSPRLEGGYCLSRCEVANPASCGEGATCVGTSGTGNCLATCQSDLDCRVLRGDATGSYRCSPRALGGPVPTGQSVCVPGDPGSALGDPCRGEGECPLGDLCIPDDPQLPFRGGYCTRACTRAQGETDCGAGHVCLPIEGSDQGLCLEGCTGDVDCRQQEGYVCASPGSGLPLACIPG